MEFKVKPYIYSCDSLSDFIEKKRVGPGDLIITNEYIIAPQIRDGKYPCDVLFQEKYGVGEPSDEVVDSMLRETEGKDYKRIIALGGGTIIDISKLFVFGGGLTCEEIFDKGKDLPKKRQLIAVPTTCGTGSEVTGISVVGFKKRGTKYGLAVPQLYADEAALISSLLKTVPFGVFATSSIDALIHSIESFVSPKANRFTRSFGRTAIETIISEYQEIVVQKELALPKDMQASIEASCLAGIAFENAGCAAVHALSYPIGAIYHVPHGKANYLVLGEVFKKYIKLGADLTPVENVLARALGSGNGEVWGKLEELLDQILSREPLGTLGIGEKECREMAGSVIANQQRLLVNNPVKLSEDDIYDIYTNCL